MPRGRPTKIRAPVSFEKADEADITTKANRRFWSLIAFLGGEMRNSIPLISTQCMKIAARDSEGNLKPDEMVEMMVIRAQPPWWSHGPARDKDRAIHDEFVAQIIKEIEGMQLDKKSAFAQALTKGKIGCIRLEVFTYYAKGKSEMRPYEAIL